MTNHDSTGRSQMNGHGFDLGWQLATLRHATERQTDILLSGFDQMQMAHAENRQMMREIAARLPMPTPPPVPVSTHAPLQAAMTQPPSRWAGATEFLKAVPPVLKALLPLTIIAALLLHRAGYIDLADMTSAHPIAKQAP